VQVLNTERPASWPNLRRLWPSAGRYIGRPLRCGTVFHVGVPRGVSRVSAYGETMGETSSRLDGHLAFHATAAVRCSRETSSVVASQSSSRRVHLGAKLVKSGHRTSWIVNCDSRVSCACAAISHIRVRLSRCKAHASWYECSPHTPQVRQRVPFPHAPLRLARLYEIVIVIVIVTDPRGTLAPRPFGCSPLAGTGTGLLTGGAARFRPRVMHRACGADPVCRQR